MCNFKPDDQVTLPPPNGLRGFIYFYVCGTCARELTPNCPDQRRRIHEWEKEREGYVPATCERDRADKYIAQHTQN